MIFRKQWERNYHDIIWLTNLMSPPVKRPRTSISFPASSLTFVTVKVDNIEVRDAQIEKSAKWRPGQVLVVTSA